ncbi:ArnT family glycosyltransferase [Sphingomonas solaris]|uniref:Glycosyltransferase family 39 protein n=1 Tax=Alterirhizorhabdus solaris TaxID=2529389 RepID=A0A558QY79_9SPHN|nr:glycosyltransferase family 39 protein [Sphingomonas solaris]TVV72017.1 glycosyltransferase family 39 protein [Sphingomonas solaris]
MTAYRATAPRAAVWHRAIMARPAWVLVSLYIAVRLVVLAAGGRFDADNLTWWMQIADVALLRHDLWHTLFYLHTQPPLFNLIVGLGLRLGPDGFLWAMGLLFAAVTLGGILAFHALARDLTGRPGLALIAAAWMCVAPAALLFSHKLYYDGLVPWLLCMALWGLHAGLMRRSVAWASFGFAMLAAVVLLRSMIHPVLFAAAAVIFVLMAHGRRGRMAAAAILPAAAIGAVLLKNALLFGVAGLSSWAPLQLDHTTVDRLPPALRARLIAEGRLSRFAVMDGFSPPPAYLAMMPPIAPTGQPSLDNLRKSTGGYNWNHIVYTKLGEARTRDALVALAANPADFAVVLGTSLYHFHRPSSEFKGLERNLAVIAPWERIANATVGLQPAAWFGGSLDPTRPQAPLLQVSYAALAVTLAFLAETALVLAALARALRSRRWPASAMATRVAVLMIGGFVLVVSSSFDVWENNRAHYDVAPLLLLAALSFVTRRGSGRRAQGEPAVPVRTKR